MLDLHRYTVNSSKRIVNNPSSRSKPHWCKSNKHYCNSVMSKYLKKYDLKRCRFWVHINSLVNRISLDCSRVYIYHTTKRNFKKRKRIKDIWDYRKSCNRINTSYLRNIKEAFIVSLINFFNQYIGNDRKRKFYFLIKYNTPTFSS